MKQFLILHYGFERPSPEDMEKWNAWFATIADRQVTRGHFPHGREFTNAGTTDLPFGPDSITGYTVIEAEDFEEATGLAGQCPIVASTRVYEVKG